MNKYTNQREINLRSLNHNSQVKTNHHASRGYRFEMEALSAFKSSALYQQEESFRLLTGNRGYCDGIIYQGRIDSAHQFKPSSKVCEIEVKLRQSIGKEPRQCLIDVLKEDHVKKFFENAGHMDPTNWNRLLVLGMVMDLDTQQSKGLCSYDQYGGIAVVYFKKDAVKPHRYDFKQAVKFYSSFQEFSDELYESYNLDDYFDRLIGDQEAQPYFELVANNKLEELSFHIMSKLDEYTHVQQLSFLKLLRHQIAIGTNKSFKNLSLILDNPNGSNHIRPFVDRGWVLKDGRSYEVKFDHIVEDLFSRSFPVKTKELFKEANLRVR